MPWHGWSFSAWSPRPPQSREAQWSRLPTAPGRLRPERDGCGYTQVHYHSGLPGKSTHSCRWVRRPTASVFVCWNWTSDGKGAYNGVIDAKWNDQSRTNGIPYLQARMGTRWVSIGDAGYEVAVGTHDYTPYEHLKDLAFRACLPQGCG